MKKIRLFCNAGMSTSMLVKKMQEAAQKDNIDVDIVAYSLSEFKEKMEEADIVLLGPQVAYEEKRIKGIAEPLGKVVGVIPMSDYGMMNGENVLKFALNL